MKPLLVIGAGNPLMGDDGIGCHIAHLLAADPRLPDAVDVIEGGTDLFRCAAQMEGRERVLVVDACSGDRPASVRVFENTLPADYPCRHSHDLSLVDAIELLRRVQNVPIVLMAVSISSAQVGGGLSPELAARLPALVDRVLAECRLLVDILGSSEETVGGLRLAQLAK